MSKIIATYLNVPMIRRICSQLYATFGHHVLTGLTSDQLCPLVWETTRILECVGFKVRAWVCNGASSNRKFFKTNHLEQETGIMYLTVIKFKSSPKIYFISDVPHLLQTIRNNIENSHGNLLDHEIRQIWFWTSLEK